MLLSLQKSILLLLFTLFICCSIYPLALLMVGQTFFPFEANGSIIRDANNKPMGSLLIAQSFTHPEYFYPRPSAANYNAAASASSSLAASNIALRNRVVAFLGSMAKRNTNEPIPADMLTTSASGLDPHITLQNALYQLDRVTTTWSTKLKRNPASLRQEITQLLTEKSTAPLGGLAGEKIINVLEVNLELRKRFGKGL